VRVPVRQEGRAASRRAGHDAGRSQRSENGHAGRGAGHLQAVFQKPGVAHQIPNAPPELLEVVEREQAFSKFCYQEFGEKADPSLQGGVAMVVTVNGEGVSDAKVKADSWTSKAGKQVNGCLNEKATRAWKIPADAVKPGQYVVQLAFRPS
jgi:hypothetical protein